MSETSQPPPVAVRDARADDLDLLAGFNAAMALETEDKPLDSATLARGVAAVLKDASRGRYLVAERGGRPVGALMLTLEWSDWRDGWFWWIQSVFVVPDARRTGVYRALYTAVLDRARAAGDVVGVRLYVEDGNAGAQRTYEALGMAPAGYRVYETVSL
ncbi:MAG: GNAT family N-acetyltransferase [Planctomycetota bacterium]|jgi:GNAT superfamily N-acetyltransferase